MENIESRLQNALQSIQDWTNRQTDPTTQPYIKDKGFYDSIANAPLENTKLASYRQTLANMELLRMANRGLPMTRERMLPIVQGLMKGEAEVAEQDANIRNEQTRRNLVSHVMQNVSDVKNPGEYMGIMKLLEAVGGTKYNPAEMAYQFSTKEQINDNQLKGASTLAGIFGNLYSQQQQMGLQREQMAQQERLANMRVAAGGRGGGIDLNFKDAYAANAKFNEHLRAIETLSKDAKYQNDPTAFQTEIERHNREVFHLAMQDPINGWKMAKMWDEVTKTMLPHTEVNNNPTMKQQPPTAINKQYSAPDNPHAASWFETVNSKFSGNHVPFYDRKTLKIVGG